MAILSGLKEYVSLYTQRLKVAFFNFLLQLFICITILLIVKMFKLKTHC